jgi:Fic-DOC domain mobile mystery protein B
MMYRSVPGEGTPGEEGRQAAGPDRDQGFLAGSAGDGNTPLDPDEAEGLIPEHIRTRGELNLWEQTNIVRAEEWAFSRRRKDLLEVPFLREVHRRMFDETWSWAGTFRKTEKSIGVAPQEIAARLYDLMKDVDYWLDHKTFPLDEIAARFHHRLVAIHPFPNGNGRHGRLMADLLLRNHGAEPFTWGRGDLEVAGTARQQYLKTLKAADRGDSEPLIQFARQELRISSRGEFSSS